jgi:hypothetical protein
MRYSCKFAKNISTHSRDSCPIYLYKSDYVYGPAAINAKVAEKAVSDSSDRERGYKVIGHRSM